MQNPLNRIHDHTLPDWIKHLRHTQLGSREPDAPQVDQALIDTITEAADGYAGSLNRVRPHKKEDGLKYAEELISGFHNESVSHSKLAQRFNLAEQPKKFSFEMVLTDETVKFHWGLPDSIHQREFRQQVSGLYPNSEIKPVDNPFPEIEPGMYLAGGKLELEKEKYRPLRGTSGPDAFETDPLRSTLSELVGYSNEVAIVQFVFTPASPKWTEGLKYHEWSADQINDSLTYGRINGSYFSPRLDDPSAKDKRAAEEVLNQEGKQAYYLNIRFLVFASSPDIAKHHAHGIGSVFSSQYHNEETGQTLLPLAFKERGIKELARRTAAREFSYDQTSLNVSELAGLAHLPGEEVNMTNVDWTRKGVGNRPPAQANRTTKPPDMRVNRDLSELGGEASAMASLSGDQAEETDTVGTDAPEEEDNIFMKGLGTLLRFFFDDTTDSDDGDDDTTTATFDIESSPERQEAFNEAYRKFIHGELTREKIKSQYNDNVADNLIRKFQNRRADELGIDLDELDAREDVFDAPGARTTPDEEETPATDVDESDTGSSTKSQTPSGPDIPPEDAEGVTDLPATPDDDLPETTDDSTGPPSPYTRGRENPAHHQHYTYDQSGTDVQLRREPGLQRYFPFELTATASGKGRAQDGDVFAGFDVRDRLVHSHTHHPDEPIWLGYDNNPMDGIREIGLEPFSWFRHMTIFGSTGKGKSTTLNMMMNQIARKGHGFVFIDPKGDTVDDLITQLPDERMDDIVWIEPGSETYDQVAGINFLEPGECETEIEFDREVESIINDLRAVLRGGEYWGPKMEGITSNIARAMIRSRRKFTLVDMYYVLADNESRAKFANVVSQEGMSFIHEYTTKIADMDVEEIDPVLRRIQDWVEDPVSRGIVAHRDGTINISHAVEEGKIILVRNTVRSDEIRKVVSTGIMRRVWSTIRKREKVEEADREPFFAIMDEFDDIASENMALDKMLSKARSGKMGVITCLQNPSQVRDIAPQTLKQMFGNTDTLLSFGVTEVDDARIIAERFDDDSIDSGTLMSLPAYTALTTISTMDEDGPMRSDPLAPDTFAPYPARRTPEEAEEIIGENLKEYGVDALEQNLDESEHALMHLGGENDLTKCFLEAVWSEQIRENALDALPGNYDTLEPAPALNINPPEMQDDETLTVTVEEVDEGFHRRTSTGFEELPDGVLVDREYIELADEDAEEEAENVRGTGGTPAGQVRINDPKTELSITDKGIRSVLEQAEDDWRHQTEKHNEVLRRAFVMLSATGMEVSIVQQDNKQELPDAVAYPPISTTVDTKRASRLLERFKADYPIAADLSDGGVIAIEAETSTYKKPAHTLQNLARAARSGQRAMFITPEMEAKDRTAPAARVNHILTDPMFIRDHLRMRPNEDAEDAGDITERDPMPLYYNKTDYLELGTPTDGERKHALIEKGKQAVWVNTHDDQIQLYDGMTNGAKKGALRMDEGFGSTNAFDVWCRFDEHNNEWVVYPGGEVQRYRTLGDLRDDWQLVYEPFVPEREFEETPTEDDWDIVQTPLPDFLSPADKDDDEETDTAGDEEANTNTDEGPPDDDAETDDTDTEPVPDGTYTSIEEVPEEAALGQQDSDNDDDTDIDLDRAGFTREAVPIPDRVLPSKLPNNTDTHTGESVTGGEQYTTIPDEALESMVPEKHMPVYRAMAALDIGENARDPVGIHDDDSSGEDETPATDEAETPDEELAPDVDTTVDEDDPFGVDDDSAGPVGILEEDDEGDEETSPIDAVTFTYAAAMTNLSTYYIANSDTVDEDSSPSDIDIDYDAVTDRFGAKDPTDAAFWQDVWDSANVNQTEAIFRDNLPGALRYGPGIRGTQAADAIRIGLAEEELVPAGDDAVRLPGPRDAYEDYLTEEEVAEMQRRDSWVPVWDALGRDHDEGLTVPRIILAIPLEYDFEEPMAQAAIGAGVDAGVIKEEGKKIVLGDQTIPTFWDAVLDVLEATPHEPLTEAEVTIALRRHHELDTEKIAETTETARDHGAVYRDDETDHFKINTPRDEKGPEIDPVAFDRDTYPPTDDDESDSDSDSDGDSGGDGSGGDSDDDPDGGDTPAETTDEKPSEKPSEKTTENTDQNTSEQTSENTDDHTDTDEEGETPATDDDSLTPTDADSESDEPDTASTSEDGSPDTETTNAPSESGDGSAARTGAHSEAEDTDDTDTTPDAEADAGSDDDGETDTTPETTETESDSDDTDGAQSDADETRRVGQTAAGEPRAEPNSTLVDADPTDLRLSPTPDLGAVQACLEEAARFFHSQLDTTIDQNVTWNDEQAFEAGYRKPETPREYFTALDEPDPAYPVEQDPEAADAMPPNEDAQTSGIQSTEDAADNTGEPAEFAAADQPYQFLGADHRGWSDELVTDKQLGWAPAFGKELFFHLESEGFSHHTMLATGLFTKPNDAYGENEAGEGYVDYTTLDDPDNPNDLSCLFRGRYIFPYYDEDGKVAFFIGRQPDFDTEYGTHPEDFTKGKYAKLATTKNYTIADEPIYGRETIVEGEPLAITEGMADAITAHAHGIPCISPVTKTFKMKHRDVLADIIKRREIPDVYFLQDSDPPKRVVLAEEDQDHDERRCERDMALRELFCTGEFPGDEMFTQKLVLEAARDGTLQAKLDDQDLRVAPPADADVDADETTPVTAEEVPIHLLETDGEFRATGPISEVIELHQHGPGVDSAVNMGRVLDTHTPSPDDTFTGSVRASAEVYREEVLNGDADPVEDNDELWEKVAGRLGAIDVDTETDETAQSADEDGQASLVPEDEPTHTDYGGTNVWLIELPQFGDEKRDLDDFLQEGWLALTPPADWALRLSLGNTPVPPDDVTANLDPAPAWMQSLADRADPVGEYPTGMAPDSLGFPTANDLPQTVGTITVDGSAADLPIYDPYIIPSDPDADRDEIAATHRWPVSDLDTLRTAGKMAQPMPQAPDVYPPLSLFGFIPTIHPSQHPAAKGSIGGLVNDATDSMDVDPQEIEDRVEEGDYRELTGNHNPLWTLDLRDLGLTPGSRGTNPFGHFGESENYFVVIDDETAYCHKRDALYNFQHFALCDMGKRDPKHSASGQTLDDLEYLHLWTYARQNNLVPEHTPIPLKGLVGYAIEHEFCEADDLEEFGGSEEDSDGDDGESNGDSGGQNTAGKRALKLPDDVYFPVLKDIEKTTGYTPARLADSDRSGGDDGDDGDDNESPDVDTETIAFDSIHRRYGQFLTGDNAPDPLKQFLRRYTNTEDGEITTDTDETMFVPKAELRDAFNAWAQINLRHVRNDPDRSVDDVDLKELPPGAFTQPLKAQVDIELDEGRPSIDDGKQVRTWFGIELTDEGANLADLEGKFTESE
ncbi:type IV secretion system DNA-binding domain-containing protein [Halorubrum laminariae]|uniref:Type IV secretion system DNA-binding domain-containing protein n=1 Tax=Halorubrum laminariae TaxID=1433523 RepID=A0ABD6C5A7_9EURY